MKSIAAVIVTYNNRRMLYKLLEDIASQTRRPEAVFVIDNGYNEGAWEETNAAFSWVEYVRMPENAGSAGGYRRGFEAAAYSHDFILTFDDDVRLQSDTIERLEQGYEQLSGRKQVGAVRAVATCRPDLEPTELRIVPWRGTLFSNEAVRRAGMPRSEYFLYGEDNEYSLRLHRFGYRFFWIPSSVCVESESSKQHGSFLGRTVAVYHEPFRLYYAFRNEIAIYREYGMQERLRAVLWYAMKVTLYFIASERMAGAAKIAAIAHGMADGFAGRLGKNHRYQPPVWVP